jgi:quercetin dioxygenase-like cupin family protein
VDLTQSGGETGTGPSEWFIGTVYMEPVASPSGPYRIAGTMVHFTPSARTAWHTHPNGQTIYVTAGIGLAQGDGGPIEVIRPGDRVFFHPGERHWHGASPKRSMTHLSLVEVDDDGNAANWAEHVTDDEYGGAPQID